MKLFWITLDESRSSTLSSPFHMLGPFLRLLLPEPASCCKDRIMKMFTGEGVVDVNRERNWSPCNIHRIREMNICHRRQPLNLA